MASKAKSVDEIQKVTLSSTECQEMIIHQMLQVLRLGPKFNGKLIFLEGEPGIGKTQMQAQILKKVCTIVKDWKRDDFYSKTDYDFFKQKQEFKGRLEVQNLSARDSGDFSGLPYNQEVDQAVDTEVTKKMMLKFSQPDFMPSQGVGILFWDEGNRVFDINLQAVLLSMWMDRGVNGHRLGDGYIQVIAGNPFNDPRFKTCKMDDAAKGRVVIVHLVPTVAEVTEHLTDKYSELGGHFLIDYLRDNKGFCNLENAESGFSPRDIDLAIAATFTLKDSEVVLKEAGKERLLSNLLNAYFGLSQGTVIMKYFKDEREITLKRVLENPSLISKMKKSDMPMNAALCKEFCQYVFVDNVYNEKISAKDRETLTQLVENLHAETKGQIISTLNDPEHTKDQDEMQKKVLWLNKHVFTRPALREIKNVWHETTTVKRTK